LSTHDADELRQHEASIKARYKEHPEAASHVFRATGKPLPDRPSIRSKTAFAHDDAGLHEKAGGDGTEAGSGELLLESLVAAEIRRQIIAFVKALKNRSEHAAA
jgi:hypothetical protein